jgi:retron-type reverse transcriptase
MAKTYNNLWEKIVDFENLYRAYRQARKGKRYFFESLDFVKDLEVNLITLQNKLIWNMYAPSSFRQYYVFEPKKRLISAPNFVDRVVHHAINRVIENLFVNKYVKETFACIIGRGTHEAVRHVAKVCRIAKRRWGVYYALKCDIHDYFASVNHNILKQIIRKTIRDKRVLNLLDIIIDSYETDGRPGRGMPIGSLTSQLFANVIFNPFDHFIKEDQKIKYYVRYMDDFVIIHHDKKYLQELKTKIEKFILGKFDLSMNPKTGIFHERQGVDFCGYRIWPTHILPRKSTIKRAKRRLRKMAVMYRTNPGILQHAHDSIQSFLGYIKHCSGWRSAKSILERIVFQRGENPSGKNGKIIHFGRKRAKTGGGRT